MNTYAIVGVGGFGREVMPLVQAMFQDPEFAGNSQAVFVDTNPPSKEINGVAILTPAEFLCLKGNLYFNIAIACSKTRERAAAELLAAGATPFSVIARNSMNLGFNEIGPGAILCPFTTITTNCKIGAFFHGNIYSYVAHDCVIGDFVTFAPNVHCNGAVVIEDHAYIGTGAVIKQGTPDRPILIGRGSVVGMGAVVTKSVAPYTTVVGNPAKPLLKAGA